MFRFSISKDALLAPLLTVAGAIDKKHALPVLSNILVELGPDHVLLTGTDLEIEISARIPCIHDGETGRTTVPARKFVDIVRSLEDGITPEIACTGNTLTLLAGRGKYRLSTLAANNRTRRVSIRISLCWSRQDQSLRHTTDGTAKCVSTPTMFHGARHNV